jgi:hypothetical protein
MTIKNFCRSIIQQLEKHQFKYRKNLQNQPIHERRFCVSGLSKHQFNALERTLNGTKWRFADYNINGAGKYWVEITLTAECWQSLKLKG